MIKKRFIVRARDPEDTDKVLAAWDKVKDTPKSVYPAQFTGNGTGFFIVEVSNPEQWARGYLSGFPYVEYTPVACYDLENWIETYRKSKK